MKKLLLLSALFIGCFKTGFSQPGALDASFGKKGIVRTDIGSDIGYSSITREVLLQTGGSIFTVFESNGISFIVKKRSDGSTDSSYGTAGFSASATIQNAHAAMQKDGKIVVAGTVTAPYDYNREDQEFDVNYDFALTRFNSDGSIDYTFNNGYMVTADFSNYYDAINSITIQDDGKILVAGFTSIYEVNPNNPDDYQIATYNLALARYTTNGALDDTFNGTGKLRTTLKVNNSMLNLVSTQANGKIIVASSTDSGVNLARYNSNGNTDTTFNFTNHIQNSNASYFTPKSLAVQSDGKIVLGGFWQNPSGNNDFVLARFNAGGSIDTTFNADGIQTTDFRTYNDVINSIAIQGDGKIVAAGSASNGSNDAFAIARYNTNGSLDNSFDADGKKMTFITSNNVYAISVAIQSNGKLVAGGYEQASAKNNLAIVSYNADGSLDNTFDRNGSLVDHFKQKNTVFTSNAVQKDGKIVTVGYALNGASYDFAVARYNIDGSIDKTFSSDGMLTTDISSSDNRANAVAIQADGRIVAAGYASNGTNNDFAVVRYNTDGSLDKSFSADGIQTTDFGSNEVAHSIALQTDGKILVGGSYALARYNPDGSLDVTFSNDGKQIPNCSIRAIKLQKDGKIVVAGSVIAPEEEGGDGFLAVGRYNSDGSIDSSFSESGRLTASVSNFFSDDASGGGSSIRATSLDIQNDGKIIVGASGGYYERNIRNFHLCIARLNLDGSFDTSFAGDGTQVYFEDKSDNASVAVQDNGKIIVQCNLYEVLRYGYYTYDEYPSGFAIARLNTSGTLDSTFGTNGEKYITQDKSIRIQSIAIANSKLYVAGYGTSVSNYGYLSSYFLLGNKAPTVKITSPANNTVYTAPAAIKLSAAASDSDGIITKVEFYNGSTLLHTETVAPYGYLWRNVAAGTYTITAKATDNAGAQTISAPVKVIVNKAPTVSLTAPTNNATYTASANIKLSAAANDADGTITKVEFYNGTTLLHTETVAPYGYLWRNVAAGTYTITAVAADNFGAKTTSAPVTITVTSPNAMMVSSRPFAKSEKTSPNDDLRISLYPNPATNIVNIYTKGLQQDKPTTILVISASGVIMKTMQLNSLIQTKVDISSLASGVYTVKIVSGDKVMHKQFVKL